MSPAVKHRSTTQGGLVKAALNEASGFRSAQDVYAVLRANGESVGLSTVYRHLQSMADASLADVIHNPDGETTYRLCGESTPAQHHHHHLVCRQCGHAEEVAGVAVERWADKVAQEYGFSDVNHTVEVFGICARCHADSPR